MNVRVFLAAAFIGSLVGCQCGGPVDLCAGVRCGNGLSCDPDTGRCGNPQGALGGGVGGGFSGSGGGTTGTGGGGGAATGGGNGGQCTPACDAAHPICDTVNNRCLICTDSAGCSGATPYCETFANGGLGRCLTCTATEGCSGATPFCDLTLGATGECVGCRTHNDCTGGLVCDFNTHTCVTGGTGGGAGGGGGGTVSNNGVVIWADGGTTTPCFGSGTGGGSGQACTTECDRGFVCVGGFCELRGSSGELQVTLRFQQAEDLDLHVVEPLPNGGTCEIYYSQPNTPPDAGLPPIPLPFPLPTPPSCGAKGWLDLDSNAACNIDNVNIENIIYPSGTAATPGPYTVRVDYYANCSATGTVPFEVEVRAFSQRRFFCGSFQPSDQDHGNANSGRTITVFTIQ